MRNGILGWMGLAAATLVVLAASPLILHRLGPAQYGIWTLATAALGATNFANAGLGIALGKFVAEHLSQDDSEGLSRTLTTGLVLVLMTSLVLGLLLFLLAPLAPLVIKTGAGKAGELTAVVRIAAVGVVALLFGSLANAVPVGLQRFGLVNAASVVRALLTWGLALAVAEKGAGIEAVVWSSVLAFWVVGAGQGVLAAVLLAGRSVHPRLSMPHTWRVARYALFSTTSGIGSQLFDSIDRVTVGIVLGASAVAYYSILTSATTRTSQFVRVFWSPLMPASSTLQARRDERGLWSHFVLSTVACVVMNLVIVVVLVGASNWLLTFWLGPATAHEIVWPFRTLVVIYAGISLAAPAYYIAFGIGAPGICAVTAVVGGLLTIAMIVALGRTFNLEGAALGNAGYLVILIIPIYVARILQRGRHSIRVWPAAARRNDV